MSTGKTRTGLALLSPALLVMAATLLAPLVALVVMSFWKQDGFDIDRTFTLANYWRLIEPGEGTVWYGIPFPLAYPVPAILMVKSLAMSLVATALRHPRRPIRWPISSPFASPDTRRCGSSC